MKALILESNRVLTYKDVPIPKVKEDECLLKVSTVGICNSDIFRAFENGAYFYPLIMGHEFSGKIIECGKNVYNLLPGQGVVVFPLIPCFKCQACKKKKWVLCSDYDYYGSRRDGAFAEYIAVKSWNIMPVPDGCDLDLAALTEPLAVAIHTLKSISEDKTGKLLILGAGLIGLSLAKLIEKMDRFNEIWVFDRNKFKLKTAERFGFSTALMDTNSNVNNSFENYFDIVIEACGAINTYRNSIRFCNNQAQLIWMGNIQGDLTFSKRDISFILRREIDIHGVWNSDYQPNGPSDWKDAVAIISKENWIRELITHIVPLSEAHKLLENLYKTKKNSLPHTYLKACIKIR